MRALSLMGAMTATTLAMINPPLHAQTAAAVRASRPDAQRLDYDLRARRMAADTWVIEGAVEDFDRSNGCNIINTAFISTGAGVVVINTGPSHRYGLQQRRLIEQTTLQRVTQVVNLNLHPDYFFGNQAWQDPAPRALPGSMAGMQTEGEAYANNLYRLCGDWMQGTEPAPAQQTLETGVMALGQHRLEWLRLSGHTADDLVLIDHSTGVAFVGGLVFADRVPTTPHADFARWLQSLDKLEALHKTGYFRWVVPSHGPVHEGLLGIAQTRDWIQWLTRHMREHAAAGRDLSEVLSLPVPARFAAWASQPAELHRTLAQWYPMYENQALDAR
jgi:quinoprotein relay system zinc metallohydrolase 1